MERLKEADGLCNGVHLKATLPEKIEQRDILLVRLHTLALRE